MSTRVSLREQNNDDLENQQGHHQISQSITVLSRASVKKMLVCVGLISSCKYARLLTCVWLFGSFHIRRDVDDYHGLFR